MTTIPSFSKMIRNRLDILSVHFPGMTGQECYESVQVEIRAISEMEGSFLLSDDDFADEPTPVRQCSLDDGPCESCQ